MADDDSENVAEQRPCVRGRCELLGVGNATGIYPKICRYSIN